MNITTPRRSRRSNRPSRESLNEAADRVAVWTNAWQDGSVRIKWNRLGDDEAASLVRLANATARGRGLDPSRLDEQERSEFEALVEKGAGLGPGWFEKTRADAGLTAEVRRLVADASRPKQPTVAEEDRLVRTLFALVQRNALYLDRVGVYMFVLGQLLAYEAESPGAWMEGTGDLATLVLRRNLGLGLDHDPTANATVRWEAAVEQLVRNGLLESEHRGGPEFRIRMGSSHPQSARPGTPADCDGVTATRRLVVEPGEPGGPPHVRIEKIVRWQLAGAVEPEPTADEIRDEFLLGLRDAGLAPEPVLSFGSDGETDPRLDWPDLGAHAVDPDHARLVALASLPLGRSCPELDATPAPDPEAEAELERVVAEDRRDRALVAAAAVKTLNAKEAARRRLSRSPRKKVKPPKPSVVFDGERERTGGDWHWTRLVPGRRRARAPAVSPRHHAVPA